MVRVHQQQVASPWETEHGAATVEHEEVPELCALACR